MPRWLSRETDLCILRKMQIDEISPSLHRRSSDPVACPLNYQLRASLRRWRCSSPLKAADKRLDEGVQLLVPDGHHAVIGSF